MPKPNKDFSAARRESYAILVNFDLPRYSDLHVAEIPDLRSLWYAK
jgi:hypothetical protein